ncbi:phage major capsid protein [uncultured Parabacteroides sp.]|jgi:hypothetical protein|uniref:phage major capsid protein n=1 Tax=uncultured Parabacteroides sp. TaxID=512312 RepID=UPI00261857E8|nr:phage major capsid protein [uncultured Parabacteroides sp.]
MEIKSFVLPAGVEFSEDEKKGLNALGDYIKGQFEEMVAGIKSQNEIIEAVKAEFGKLGLSPEKVEKLEGALKAQGVEIATMKKGTPKQEGHKTLVAAMEEVLKSEEFAAAYKDIRSGRGSRSTGEFALKLDTSNVTNEDPNRTVLTTKIYADASPRNAFVQLFSRINVPDDKNRIMYNDASYTDGTGYAEEMKSHTNTDAATLTGKYRELSKLGAVLPFSAESAEDFGYFLAWAQTKAQQGIAAKLDTLLWDGDGVDASQPKHIYGLKKSGVTAFNATTTGVAASVSAPNIADLILAMKTQAKVETNDSMSPNYVLMNYATEFKMRTLKNTLGDYITVLPNGALSVHGMTIIPTPKLSASELVVLDSTTLQLHDKRNITMEIERVPETDSYRLWLWYRGQALVTRPDMKANIYVADIDTALAAIEKAASE